MERKQRHVRSLARGEYQTRWRIIGSSTLMPKQIYSLEPTDFRSVVLQFQPSHLPTKLLSSPGMLILHRPEVGGLNSLVLLYLG